MPLHHQSNIERIVFSIDKVRRERPHIHCITNYVAQSFTANVLLAIGALPSMTTAISEIEDFVRISRGVLINLGTINAQQKQSIKNAAYIAQKLSKPWALDPVFVEVSHERFQLARYLIAHSPTIIRLNAKEFEAVTGEPCTDLSVQEQASLNNTIFAVTGLEDRIANNHSMLRLGNGTATMERVTAVGCALTAVLIAVASVETDYKLAAVAGITWLNIAGEIAAETSEGPGSFSVALIDKLATVNESQIRDRIKIL
ncbi:hydroxyethylthiazole kinase [Candidatus Endowatersipora endosymbiont of Watersipora subatra]|uniref:hydroxyethylthiazole kinase n=1 Tax=Candidatus Endowatersipora endosymbiont of Watersipora subatra TaxID=3077946 RepID=UPI00312CA50E